MGGIYGSHQLDGLARPDSSLGGMAGANGDIQPLEHITRVRLVQFQKNTDEPMVAIHPIDSPVTRSIVYLL